ncbi:2-pyrone-4,6-dicarboxylate hydrolase [Allopusillimonas soli]|nr:2-pyrone-4,6-dicarboxylate hydrolase [Allopusillimonas soli]
MPNTAAPTDACDAHIHIYEQGSERRAAAVENADVAQYRQIQALLGTRRTVVIQPRVYGTDNSVTLRAIAALGAADTRGIAVIAPDIDDTALHALHEGGIRGIRFSFHAPNENAGGFDVVEALAHRVQTLGWHLQLHWTASQIVENAAMLQRLPGQIVFDHLGRLPLAEGTSHPAFSVVRRLLEDGRAWLKLSGAYLNTRQGMGGYHDVDDIARAWIRAAPTRLVWGSDWPHVTEPARKPDDAELFDLLARWCGDSQVLERILVDNPARLYGFDDE